GMRRVSEKSAEDALRWCLERFAPDKLILASSFGPEDLVLIDMLSQLGRFPRVVTLDTGRLPQETHDVIDAARRRYNLSVEILHPDAEALGVLAREHGPNPFYRSVELRRLCCRVRKVAPLRRALAQAQAWITGVRREQSPSRAGVKQVEW